MTHNQIQDRLDIALLDLNEHAYASAYDSLTSILNLEPTNPSALKLRAQAALGLYDKRRDTALDDIEAALRQSPNTGDLYLIQNQVLLSRNDYVEANIRLKKAPFCVFHDDPKISEIRELYEMQSLKERNYLVTMATEIVYNVMISLPFKHRVRSLAVSRRWRDTLRRIPDLWRDPDYTDCRSTRSDSIAQSLATLTQWTDIRKLSVALTVPIAEQLVKLKCRTIAHVCFLRCSQVSALVLQLTIKDIGSTWCKAEIDGSIDASLFCYAVATHCPKLTELVIHRGMWESPLPQAFSTVMPPLKINKLHLINADPPFLLTAMSHCPNVTDLIVEERELATFESFQFRTVLSQAKHLKRLALQFPAHVTIRITDTSLFFRSLPDLDVLDLNKFTLTRESIALLADNMQKGTLKCFNDSFDMAEQPERNRLLNVAREYSPQRRPAPVIEINDDNDVYHDYPHDFPIDINADDVYEDYDAFVDHVLDLQSRGYY